MQRIVFLLLNSLLFSACLSKVSENRIMPYYNQPDFTPVFIENIANVKQSITHQIGDFSLLNQDSNLVTQTVFRNKIHVANFIFTTCGSICPVMTQNFKIVADSLKNDSAVILLSYSVTPWIDQPSVLKNYRKKNGINHPNWQFLTGDRTLIYKLARQSYFAEEDLGFSKDSSQFLHTEHFILVDKTKRIRGVYNGTLRLEMHHLIEDIKSLEKETE